MPKLERAALAEWWTEAWESGLWASPWKQAVEGLSAAQAVWSPGPGRHSIWQLVNHMMFWREDNLLRLAGKPRLPEAERDRRNFEAPRDVTEAAWHKTLSRFAESQRQTAAAIADPKSDTSRIEYLIPHDNYHIGQIMYVRAMQGLKPIE